MHTKEITWFGRPAVVACDGNCAKAWGICQRPKLALSADPNDVAYLADGELGEAPADPGTYEGGHGKPAGPHSMNKWCSRECERSEVVYPPRFDKISLPDWSRRIVNQPWKYETLGTPGDATAIAAAGQQP